MTEREGDDTRPSDGRTEKFDTSAARPTDKVDTSAVSAGRHRGVDDATDANGAGDVNAGDDAATPPSGVPAATTTSGSVKAAAMAMRRPMRRA